LNIKQTLKTTNLRFYRFPPSGVMIKIRKGCLSPQPIKESD